MLGLCRDSFMLSLHFKGSIYSHTAERHACQEGTG